MSTLLIGRWDDDHTLIVTKSHQVADGDQAAINALVEPAFADGADWACEFDVDRHRSAVQRAYEEYARDRGAQVQDDVEGFEPATNSPTPGNEYPYAVSDIARRAATLLGPDWGSESGYWGVTGQIHTPAGDTVTIGIDHEGDLYVDGPRSLEPVYLEDVTAPHDEDALTAVAEIVIEVTLELV